MRKIILGTLASLAFVGSAFAADSANHTVTVTVSAINEIAISGGNVTLAISTATAGLQPDAATPNTATSLSWTTNEDTRKISVGSSVLDQKYTLKVSATGVSGGTAAAQVTLIDATAYDLVTGVSKTTGGAGLEYSASATAAAGTGSDVHTVTYTITASGV